MCLTELYRLIIISRDCVLLFRSHDIEMQQTISISTPAHNGLYDITRQVEAIVAESGVLTGMVNVYAQGATAASMM